MFCGLYSAFCFLFYFFLFFYFCLFFFFFSSRRRHTRCLSDWSSDVCSSDLNSFCLVHGLCVVQGQRSHHTASRHQRDGDRRARRSRDGCPRLPGLRAPSISVRSCYGRRGHGIYNGRVARHQSTCGTALEEDLTCRGRYNTVRSRQQNLFSLRHFTSPLSFSLPYLTLFHSLLFIGVV